jgi:hypothetical protein
MEPPSRMSILARRSQHLTRDSATSNPQFRSDDGSLGSCGHFVAATKISPQFSQLNEQLRHTAKRELSAAITDSSDDH